MAIEAELFDGTILEFPDNTDPSVIDATAAKVTKEKQVKQNTSGLGDFGTALKESAVGSVKSMTDVFGAENPASQYLGDVQQRINKEYSQKAVEEMQRRQEIIKEAEKSGSTLKEIQAYLGGVAEAPLRAGAQGVGSLLPYIGTGVLGAGARGLGLASKVLPSARAVNIGLGTAQGAGAIKGSIYDTVKAELEAKGENPDIAAEKAYQMSYITEKRASQKELKKLNDEEKYFIQSQLAEQELQQAKFNKSAKLREQQHHDDNLNQKVLADEALAEVSLDGDLKRQTAISKQKAAFAQQDIDEHNHGLVLWESGERGKLQLARS